jgi:hypothetical protein
MQGKLPGVSEALESLLERILNPPWWYRSGWQAAPKTQEVLPEPPAIGTDSRSYLLPIRCRRL